MKLPFNYDSACISFYIEVNVWYMYIAYDETIDDIVDSLYWEDDPALPYILLIQISKSDMNKLEIESQREYRYKVKRRKYINGSKVYVDLKYSSISAITWVGYATNSYYNCNGLVGKIFPNEKCTDQFGRFEEIEGGDGRSDCHR